MIALDVLRKVSRSYRHAQRYREILGILVKNGFGYWFNDRRFVRSEQGASPLADELTGQRLVQTLTALGPTFVKFGQMLSCRPDLLPAELIRALAKLQTAVPPFPHQEAVATLEKELGKPLAELFAEFPETPTGSASVAQGYHARLVDNREVFVKIQRPGILPRIMIDLDILMMLARRLEKSVPELAVIRPEKIVQDFREGFLKELDFLNEAANMRAFGKMLQGDGGVVVPEPVAGYCTKRVLTMSYIKALPFTDMAAIKASGVDCQALAELGVRLLQRQIFETGFFHGDPHPGNMFALAGPKIAYIDFGIMGRLTGRERRLLRKMASALFFDDMRELARNVAALSEAPEAVDLDALERDLATLVTAHLHGSVSELSVTQFILDLHQLCYRRSLQLSPHLFRMVRTMGYADAMGRALVPDFNILSLLKPYVVRQSIAEFNPVHKAKDLWRTLSELSELLHQAPHLTKQIAERLRDGKLTVRYDRPDVRQLAENVKRGARRLTDALLLAVLWATGALFVLFKVEPLWGKCSALGAVILTVAGIMLLCCFFRKD